MTDSERTEWAAIVEWARHVEASPDDLVPSVISIIDAPVALAVDDELNRLRAENANLSRSLAAVTQGLDGTGKVLAETLAERDRTVAERDALIECGLKRHANGKWSASLAGNFDLGVFRSRDEAVRAMLDMAAPALGASLDAGIDRGPQPDPPSRVLPMLAELVEDHYGATGDDDQEANHP